jgi:CubicO group peptidase (beta-lactamase class C family)
MSLKPYIVLVTMALVSCNNSLESRLDRILKPIFPANEPGAAILVLQGNDILFDKGYGLARMAEVGPEIEPDSLIRREIGFSESLPKNNFPENPGIPESDFIDGNTHFNIASVSKQFTAVAILQLVQEGKISLEDPVSQYFPEFESKIWDEINIKHLLSHSSGIPDIRADILTREQRVFGDENLSVEYLKTLDHRNFAPGTAYEYMNPTYTLMGFLVERVSGEPFTEYVQKHIFNPAGMDNTYYFDRDNERPDAAHGYIYDNGWKEYDFGEETFFATRPDGGIYTTTHEFVKWEKALREGRVLDPDLLAQAMTEHTQVSYSPWSDYQNRPNTWYGYGWFIEPALDGAPRRVYHTGDNGGFMIMAARYPEQDLLILIFANRNDWDRYELLMKLEKEINFN